MNFIDRFLNGITMYRLLLYFLTLLIAVATLCALWGLLPYSPIAILFSTTIATAVCWIMNELCAWIFKAHPNVESVYITAFILALIVTPAPPSDLRGVAFLVWACVFAIASKYVLAIGRKHIFNPAAFGVAFVSLTLGGAASWWVGGNLVLLPLVLIGGLLVVRKLQRFDLVLSFMAVALVVTTLTTHSSSGVWVPAWQTILHSPLFFLAFIMLTEPLTAPPTRALRVAYGAIVGALFTPMMHIASFYFTPEIALVAGNVFSYLVSPKGRLMLRLKKIEQTSASTSEFVFASDVPLSFKPGQYLEWTLPHQKSDARGNRRYFTISSSPTEPDIRFGVKFYDPPSSFKRTLADMRADGEISASQLAGEFIMPEDKTKKLVFIAGGIGITPFRSMIKHLLDTKDKRSVLLLYSNKKAADIAYRPLFDQVQRELGIKTIYAITGDPDAMQKGYVTVIDAHLIKKEVPDYLDRVFYLSGPRAMVLAFRHSLRELGVPRRHIKEDFFPGFV